MFKFNKGNTRKRPEKHLKLAIKTPKDNAKFNTTIMSWYNTGVFLTTRE